MDLVQKKKNRYDFLLKLHEITNGDTNKRVAPEIIGDQLGFERPETNLITDYLSGENLIEITKIRTIKITHSGIKEIEAYVENPERLTQQPVPLNMIQNFGIINGLQQGNGNSSFNHNSGTDTKADLVEIVTTLNIIKDSIQLIPELMDEFISDIQTLEAQKNSPKPKVAIIKESLNSVRSILEGTAGGIGTTLATNPNLLQKLESIIKSIS